MYEMKWNRSGVVGSWAGVDDGCKLLELRVDVCFNAPPIVLLVPIYRQRRCIVLRRPVGEVRLLLIFGEARESYLQLGHLQKLLVNIDVETHDILCEIRLVIQL